MAKIYICRFADGKVFEARDFSGLQSLLLDLFKLHKGTRVQFEVIVEPNEDEEDPFSALEREANRRGDPNGR